MEIFLSYSIREFLELKIFPAGFVMRGWKDGRKDIMNSTALSAPLILC